MPMLQSVSLLAAPNEGKGAPLREKEGKADKDGRVSNLWESNKFPFTVDSTLRVYN